jgi:putative ABC transport system ATP-binding protein
MSEKNSIKPLLASVLLEAKNLSHNFDYELFKNINLSLAKKESKSQKLQLKTHNF